MMRTFFLALLIALIVTPAAIPQGNEVSVEKRVKLLEADLAVAQGKLEKQEVVLKDVLARLENLKAEGSALVKAVEKSRKDGFAYPAPNVDSREGLLNGLQRFGEAVATQKKE